MQIRSFLVALTAVAALVACGGSGSNSGGLGTDGGLGPTINSFTAAPASLPAVGGDVVLSWSVSNATSLSIDQSVGDVTSVSSNSKTVHVTSSKTFTLTATGAGGNASRQASVAVASTTTVAGQVLDSFGHAAANVPVTVSGKAPVNTDASGRFSLSGVTTPYDVTILNGGDKIGMVYKGLTRSDPTLFYSTYATPQSATVSGKVTGPNFPQPAQHVTQVAFASSDVKGSTNTATNGDYIFNPIRWSGPMATAGTLHALQIREMGSGLPAEYKGYGKRDLTLSNGATFSSQDIPLSPVSAAPISGTVSVPSGYAVADKEVAVVIGSSVVFSLLYDNSAATTFSYLAPNIPSGSLIVVGGATKAGVNRIYVARNGILPGATGVNFTVPPGPEATLPIDAATGVTTATNFSWTPQSGVVYFAQFIPSVAGKPQYFVATAGNSATLPDLASVGLGVPAATNYSWTVTAIGPFADMDAATAPSSLLTALNLRMTVDETVANTETRTFTTAP